MDVPALARLYVHQSVESGYFTVTRMLSSDRVTMEISRD
jgi:hypothetical protein